MSSTQGFKRAINGASPDLIAFISDLVDDLAAIRTALIGALAKLDDDANVADEDYESLFTPAALKTKK